MLAASTEISLMAVITAASIGGRSGLAETVGLEAYQRGLMRLDQVSTILLYTSQKEELASFFTKCVPFSFLIK